ncbi:hypothetical protein N7532_004901 [Penicillium argentinense]|uniref:Uncharacterized protein n=1 Tax=Penicillium argentinense TaxID=1131581 RepID=A0A9W9FD52_9EURO|nr:uncharacterized protein N7532_004901 [Penicillium argentinense]KAJ5097900.1 hypothetical protein N7532_004901 [Penicillium argentinense]
MASPQPAQPPDVPRSPEHQPEPDPINPPTDAEQISVDRGGTSLAMEAMLPLLLLPDGDTLVYIDPPPACSPPRRMVTSTIPHRIHSAKLLATGSKYFSKLFQPRVQARVAKQRGFGGGLPEGIHYLLDLTPPILEDDAIIQVTEISCPLPVRTWAWQKNVWRLPRSCIGGLDSCESAELILHAALPPLASSPEEDDDWDQRESSHLYVPAESLEGDSVDDEPHEGESSQFEDVKSQAKQMGLPVEYSAERHREGIEHLLHVLEGLSITLNTPSKMWTFFALAKVFDVPTVPTVSGYILAWFYEGNNTKFIDAHPEIAYRVACTIKSSELCRRSFVILVGDEALLYTIRSAQITPLHTFVETFSHSRIRDFLEDTEVQRIEYASKSFSDYIIDRFLHLAGAEMSWMEDNRQFQKIAQHRRQFPEDHRAVDRLIDHLKVFVRYRIYRILEKVKDPARPGDATGSWYRSFKNPDILPRLIGRSFWYNLLSLDLNLVSDIDDKLVPHATVSDIGPGLLAFKDHEKARLCNFGKPLLELETGIFNRRVESQIMKKHNPFSFHNLTINLRHSPPTPNDPSFLSDARMTADSNIHSRPLTLNQRQNSDGSTCDSVSTRSFPMFFSSPGETSLPANAASDLQDYSDTCDHMVPTKPSSSYFENTDSDKTQMKLEIEQKKFDLNGFLTHASASIRQYVRDLLFRSEYFSEANDGTETLNCLTERQLRFLPLWAGGDDDGSGGVFSENIPIMEDGGFSTPGPAIHTGSVASTEESFSDLDPFDSRSTVQGASHHATHSHISYLQSVSSVAEGSVVQVDVDVDAAASDGNSTVMMSHQSDIGDDLDMNHPDDFDNDEDNYFTNDANVHDFEIL